MQTVSRRFSLGFDRSCVAVRAYAKVADFSTCAGLGTRNQAGLPRRLRDLRASAQHVAMSPNNFIIAGRMAVGLDPGTARI